MSGPNVRAKVSTLQPGDTVYPPSFPEGRPVVAVESYDDGDVVVTYSTGRSTHHRFGDEVLQTADVLASFHSMPADSRVPARRAGE